MENLVNPVILFFGFGILAGILKSDIRLPESIYEGLSIYLLLAIGLKGGVELSNSHLVDVIIPSIGTILLGVIIPIIAYFILHKIGKLDKINSAAIAAHYGSVSAVTFAVVITYAHSLNISYESYVNVLLVLMEVPAIIMGVYIAKKSKLNDNSNIKKLLHELFFSKSVYLLVAGLLIGYFSGEKQFGKISAVFVEPFYGALAFFLFEMGLIAASKLYSIKSVGFFLFGFAIIMPVLSSILGIFVAVLCGLSAGGTLIVATLAASSSYIAAPAAMRLTLPEANPTYYITASLAITFPFNIVFGIPLYHQMIKFIM
ncbi:hypothetical protein MROS_2614 [Melioribacter roseus P3M-2]|uniref:Sodium-dependent bicarbonate transport family permease n=1 Tax=Melioribacter roseus (strain DSM 23840 / JCM 17771 / VKM B-2668 / P3M-2) TaxID=1191523 RepID=I6ZUY8_MELRP|nr:sodium-dependent bicarbonate transport family permease [Melioribacter roseus]AFN75844.1 hypothetical protein MROS_2614 [Melioribacter roseus P3M-2]